MAGDSSLCDFDRGLVESATLIVLALTPEQKNVEFQFPPKIVGESNASNWNETSDVMSIERVKYMMGAQGRRLDVEWEHIATDNVWTPDKIFTQLNNLKSYFYEFSKNGYPIISFKYTKILDSDGGVPFRMKDFNISNGPEYIKGAGGYFPLYSKVKIGIELVTTLASAEDVNKKVKMPQLKNVRKEWY